MQHRDTARVERVELGQVWRWLAPWLLGGFLAGAAFLGFYAASRAQDDGTYILGFVTAGLALLMLVWRVKVGLDGGSMAPVLVDDGDALVVVIALLAILAIGGLVLAARGGASVLEAVGYALFGFCLVFIFGNLKHYFDVRERRRRG